MEDVTLIPAEPRVQIVLTKSEFNGLLEAVLGKGGMQGAWDKIRKARDLLSTAEFGD